MADFKNMYPGYADDLTSLIDGLGQMERMRVFRDYMSEKAEDNSNPQKAEAARVLAQYFSDVISAYDKVGSKLKNELSHLERLADRNEEELSGQEKDRLQNGGELETRFFEALNGIQGIKNAMTRYNEADGYNELRDNPEMQEMFKAVEELDGLMVKKGIIDSKSTKYEINKKAADLVKRSEELDKAVKTLVDKKIDLDTDKIDSEAAKTDKLVEEKSKEYDQLRKPATKDMYERIYREQEQEIVRLKKRQEEESRAKEENDEIINEESKAVEILVEEQVEEAQIQKKRDKLKADISVKQKEYNNASDNYQQEKAANDYINTKLQTMLEGGAQKEAATAYYHKRMAHEKAKKAYNDFQALIKAHTKPGPEGDFDNNLIAIFANSDKIEKVMSQNPQQKAELDKVKRELNDIAELSVDQSIFTRASDMNVRGHAAKILQQLDSAVRKTEQEYKDDESYKLMSQIKLQRGVYEKYQNWDEKNLEDIGVQLKANSERIMDLETEFNRRNLANTDEIDKVVSEISESNIRLKKAKEAADTLQEELTTMNGVLEIHNEDIKKLRTDNFNKYSTLVRELRKQKREGSLSDQAFEKLLQLNQNEIEGVSVTELINGLKDDIKIREEQNGDYYFKKLNEIDDALIEANENKAKHAPGMLEKEIKRTGEKLNNAKAKLKGLKELQAQMDQIHKDYCSITKDQKAFSDKYAGNLNNDKIVSPLKEKIAAFVDGFHRAIKKKDYKDSNEYKAINDALKKLNSLDKGAPISEIRSRMQQLKKASADYITAKNKQVRPFPSRQRVYRLNYAASLEKFCDSQLAALSNNQVNVEPKTKSYLGALEEMNKHGKNKIMDKKDFFKVYPKRLMQQKDKQQELSRRSLNRTSVSKGKTGNEMQKTN